MTDNRLRLAVALLAVALVGGCGGNEIRDIPPLLQIRQMELLDDRVRLSMRIRNPNEIAIQARELNFDLLLDNTLFARYSGAPDIDVIANSAEEFQLVLTPLNPNLLAELREFIAAQQGSVHWMLEGRLHLEQDIKSKFSHEGRLFPVPGRDNLLR